MTVKSCSGSVLQTMEKVWESSCKEKKKSKKKDLGLLEKVRKQIF